MSENSHQLHSGQVMDPKDEAGTIPRPEDPDPGRNPGRYPGYNNSLPHNYTNYYSQKSGYPSDFAPTPASLPPQPYSPYWRNPLSETPPDWESAYHRYIPMNGSSCTTSVPISASREGANSLLSSSLYSPSPGPPPPPLSGKYGSNNHISSYSYSSNGSGPYGSLRKRPGVYVYGQLQTPAPEEEHCASNGILNRGYNANLNSTKCTSYSSGMDVTSTAAAAALVRQLEEKLNQVIAAPGNHRLPAHSGPDLQDGSSSITSPNGHVNSGLDIISHVPYSLDPPSSKFEYKNINTSAFQQENGTAQPPNVIPGQIRRPNSHSNPPRLHLPDEEDGEDELCFLLSPFSFCPCLSKSAGASSGDNDSRLVNHNGVGVREISAAKDGGNDNRSGGRIQRGGQDQFKSDNYLKSIWIHCRLPLLLLTVSVLIILFLLFSGALIYFKYVPFRSRASIQVVAMPQGMIFKNTQLVTNKATVEDQRLSPYASFGVEY